MEKFKKFISYFFVSLMVAMVLIPLALPHTAYAEEPEQQPEPETKTINKTINFEEPTKEYSISLNYKGSGLYSDDVNISISSEQNEEILKKFEKYAKKKVDAGDIGEVFYVTTEYQDEKDKNNLSSSYKFTIKLPKFYHNKELAIIPFTDQRTTQSVKPVTVDESGSISFNGNRTAYAYVLVYNGVYKDIILIVLILIVVLVICVSVKVICLRKDNPYYQEKKRDKAIAKKKAQHKQNKKLAQALKREKEKIKK